MKVWQQAGWWGPAGTGWRTHLPSLQTAQVDDWGLQPRAHQHLAGDRTKILRHQGLVHHPPEPSCQLSLKISQSSAVPGCLRSIWLLYTVSGTPFHGISVLPQPFLLLFPQAAPQGSSTAPSAEPQHSSSLSCQPCCLTALAKQQPPNKGIGNLSFLDLGKMSDPPALPTALLFIPISLFLLFQGSSLLCCQDTAVAEKWKKNLGVT